MLFTSGGGLETSVGESMGEEEHVMLLLARDLGCDLRVGRTFRTPQYYKESLRLYKGHTEITGIMWGC